MRWRSMEEVLSAFEKENERSVSHSTGNERSILTTWMPKCVRQELSKD